MSQETKQPEGQEGEAPVVLIVDDEPAIVRALSYLLSRASLDIRIAQDGDEALAAIEEHRPSLVLLDVMLPKRDGFEICQTVRANPDFEDIRIIMLTARGRDADREKGLALGADEYLTKPFSTREVLAKVRRFLDLDA